MGKSKFSQQNSIAEMDDDGKSVTWTTELM
jgi:hypothetical protein